MADVTIYTLAKELNMTPSMISRAFNPEAKIREEKRKLILETAGKYNFSPNKFASRLSMQAIKIGIIINSKFHVNTEKMTEGITLAHEGLKDYKISYDITIIKNPDTAVEECEKALKKYCNFDGVILTGMSSGRFLDMINDFYKINPNVVQVQAINEEANCLFVSKHDEDTASRMGAEILYNCLRKSERKNVVLLTGNQESKLHLKAKSGFEKACGEFGLNLLGVYDMKDSEGELKKVTEHIFGKYKDELDGIYTTSGISLALCEYIKENNVDVSFVAFDLYEEIRRYLSEGIISATIEQNVKSQMQKAFETL